jgi:hypothetical protein
MVINIISKCTGLLFICSTIFPSYFSLLSNFYKPKADLFLRPTTQNLEVPKIIIPTIGFGKEGIAKSSDIKQIFDHIGDLKGDNENDYDLQKRADFNLNVGRALEVLRRELPMVFYVSNIDFSIFANQITVCDGGIHNKMTVQKQLYSTVVKSLRVASSISFTNPSMNVKKIEYIESCRTIQCLVDVVLPDTIRIEGQSLWEGLFYFGLDHQGLIETHIFDRKISNLRPSSLVSPKLYPWLRAAPTWNPELISVGSGTGAGGGWGGEITPVPVPSYATVSSESSLFEETVGDAL